ncbi:MAG: NADH-quinone oxidoreductase subunit [Frankiales bacterium]|jgi:NADH-quinone oxidoreductase subunit L|nr:NADH-quinone oxidoreductase subunit [Frankiales bacterium]
MSSVAWLVPGAPAVLAAVALLLGRRLPGGPAVVSLLGTLTATVVAIGLLPSALAHPARTVVHSYVYTPTGGVALHVGTSVNGLSAVLAVMVCLVSLLVQVYSIGYLHGDRRLPSYFAWVSLFTAAMLLVVVASDLLELYVGWEVMGICSYLLVGHYRESRGAGVAAIKAFLVTRLGDVAFLFGIFALGTAAHSFAIADVTRVSGLPHGTVVAGTLLLLGGVVGKSAQFPLQTWLPDAMAGPTPVSALIHAATMVAAGVFVVARLYPDFAASPVTMTVLALSAVVTMLLSALAALVQDDLKRVLAWSTVSQLAYMTAGLAVGGYQPALFHLLNHAAFKALLFLAAGAVLHAVGTNLMSEMGGLWRRMPLTFVTFCVGALALAGVPPFSGAFSKDTILDAARRVASGDHAATGVSSWLGVTVYAAGLVTVVLTALYTTRMVARTFLGPRHDDAALDDTSWAMAAPLVILALPSAGLGVLALHRFLPTWLPSPVAGTFGVDVAWAPLLLTLALVAVSVVAVLLLVRAKPDRDPALLLRPPVRLALAAGLGVDAAYRSFVVRPVMGLARLVLAVDTDVVDGTVNASGRTARWAGGVVKLTQSGNVQAYATLMLLGVVVLAIAVAVP